MIIKRGYIYFAKLDPTVGNEINKTRPVLVISNNINSRILSEVGNLSFEYISEVEGALRKHLEF